MQVMLLRRLLIAEQLKIAILVAIKSPIDAANAIARRIGAHGHFVGVS